MQNICTWLNLALKYPSLIHTIRIFFRAREQTGQGAPLATSKILSPLVKLNHALETILAKYTLQKDVSRPAEYPGK